MAFIARLDAETCIRLHILIQDNLGVSLHSIHGVMGTTLVPIGSYATLPHLTDCIHQIILIGWIMRKESRSLSVSRYLVHRTVLAELTD